MLMDRCDSERQMRRFVRVVADFSIRLVGESLESLLIGAWGTGFVPQPVSE